MITSSDAELAGDKGEEEEEEIDEEGDEGIDNEFEMEI